jgi:hypothetical protein
LCAPLQTLQEWGLCAPLQTLQEWRLCVPWTDIKKKERIPLLTNLFCVFWHTGNCTQYNRSN